MIKDIEKKVLIKKTDIISQNLIKEIIKIRKKEYKKIQFILLIFLNNLMKL